MSKSIDLTNQKFNRLLVLERDYNYSVKSKETYWKCLCDCGNITTVRGRYLRNGSIKSCGCLRKNIDVQSSIIKKQRAINDLTGQRFGRLTILEPTKDRQENCIVWKCQCDCGNICYANTHSLKNGKKLSCGCYSSKGENLIYSILTNNNIQFETQKTFQDCRFQDTNQMARFDFFLPEYNTVIEYNGIQHYIENTFFKQPLEKIQQHDLFKQQWCINNNINFIVISYKELDKITVEYLMEKINYKFQGQKMLN